jgi:hypothetical protein
MSYSKIIGLSKLAATLVFAPTWMAPAQEYVSVSSTTDGQGLFSYTFDLGDTSYVWGMSQASGNIFIPSHGILDVISPPGWLATVDANEFITWQPTNSTIYIGQPPLTFSVISSYTNSILYDQWGVSDAVYMKGFISGTLFTISDHQSVGGGFETFSFLGPQVNLPCFLNIRRDGDAVVLSWTNSAFALQSAPSPIGNYTNIVGAISPFTNNISEVMAYFRLISN